MGNNCNSTRSCSDYGNDIDTNETRKLDENNKKYLNDYVMWGNTMWEKTLDNLNFDAPQDISETQDISKSDNYRTHDLYNYHTHNLYNHIDEYECDECDSKTSADDDLQNYIELANDDIIVNKEKQNMQKDTDLAFQMENIINKLLDVHGINSNLPKHVEKELYLMKIILQKHKNAK